MVRVSKTWQRSTISTQRQAFFDELIKYLRANCTTGAKSWLLYTGKRSYSKMQGARGLTNPEEATHFDTRFLRQDLTSGFMRTHSCFLEHRRGAERNKTWFSPDEIIVDLYPTKTR